MYTFRLVQPSDIPWLDMAALAAAAEHPQEGVRAGLGPRELALIGQQRIRTTLSSPTGSGVIAQLGHMPVGFALVATGSDGTTEETFGYLLDLWVAPGHRRQGLGQRLLLLSEALLTAAGARKMKAVFPADRVAGMRLAERCGFQPEGLIGMKAL